MTHFQTVNPFFIDALILPPNFLIRILQFIAGPRWLGIGPEWSQSSRLGAAGEPPGSLLSNRSHGSSHEAARPPQGRPPG